MMVLMDEESDRTTEDTVSNRPNEDAETPTSPDTIDEQRPVTQSLRASMRHETHWHCLLLSLLIYTCLGVVTWCQFTHVTKMTFDSSSTSSLTISKSLSQGGGGHSMIYHDSPWTDVYFYIPLALLLMLYAVYLIECWHCRARSELQYKSNIDSVYERVLCMRRAQPCVWWKAIGYHYVRRTRQVTRYRNGDAYTTTQVYNERVNTHVVEGEFDYSHCGMKDISRELRGLECHPVTRLRFSKCFSFAGPGPEDAYLNQRFRFFSEIEGLDDHMEAEEGMKLKNIDFREHLIAYVNPDQLPWYSSQVTFWLAAILMLSWPLRVWIEYRTAYVHYQVEKLFGLEYNNSSLDSDEFHSTVNNHCVIPRGETVDSTELEWHVLSNRQLIPSYSESILMNLGNSRPAQANIIELDGLLLNDSLTQSYGTMLQDCDHRCHFERTRHSTVLSNFPSLSQNTLHSCMSQDTSHFSLCRINGSSQTLGLWRSHSSTMTECCCLDEQHCRSHSSQLALNNSPPNYHDARFFPVLIVHRSEGCRDASEVRRYYVQRSSLSLETPL